MSSAIVIIGAGLGGLTAGLALRRFGFDVAIYEQAPALEEVGAGLSLSQAAQSVYRALGLAEAIDSIATVTAGMAFLHYRSGALLAGQLDQGQGSGDPSAPLAALQVHRADLQSVLSSAFTRAGGRLHLNKRLTDLDVDDGHATARFSDGECLSCARLIGADGLKSQVRAVLWGTQAARFTGQVAYRFLVPIDNAREFLQFGRSAVFQGPGRVFNRYTIRNGTLLNCVGIVKTDQWQDDGWSTPADREAVLAAYAGWHPDVTGLIRCGERMIKWGLFDRPPLACWSAGPVTLLGDAAHPMLPFLGLGAAMAIEDAMILARAVSAYPDRDTAFARYEALRQPRTRLVQAQSLRQGDIVQRVDPERFAAAAPPSHDTTFYAYDPVTDTI